MSLETTSCNSADNVGIPKVSLKPVDGELFYQAYGLLNNIQEINDSFHGLIHRGLYFRQRMLIKDPPQETETNIKRECNITVALFHSLISFNFCFNARIFCFSRVLFVPQTNNSNAKNNACRNSCFPRILSPSGNLLMPLLSFVIP